MPSLDPVRPTNLAAHLDVAEVIERPLENLHLADHVGAFDTDKNGRVTIGEAADLFDGLQNTSSPDANRKLARTIVLGIAGRNAVQQVNDLWRKPTGNSPAELVWNFFSTVPRIASAVIWAPAAVVNASLTGASTRSIDHTGARTHVGGADLTTTDTSAEPLKKTPFKAQRLIAMVEKYGSVVDGEVRLYEADMKKLVDDTIGAEKSQGTGFLKRFIGKRAALGELTGLPFQVVGNSDPARDGDRWITVSDFVGILNGDFWKKYQVDQPIAQP